MKYESCLDNAVRETIGSQNFTSFDEQCGRCEAYKPTPEQLNPSDMIAYVRLMAAVYDSPKYRPGLLGLVKSMVGFHNV